MDVPNQLARLNGTRWKALVGIGLVVLLVAGYFAGPIFWRYWTHDRHVEKLDFTIAYHGPGEQFCKTDTHPLWVAIINNSSRTVERITFSLEAKRKGRSSSYSAGSAYLDDRIRAPSEGYASCYPANLIPGYPDMKASELIWSGQIDSVMFAK